MEKLTLSALEKGDKADKGDNTLTFNVDRNGKRYAVQLKKVKWDQGDKLEKSQMLQVVVQFSFFAFALDHNKNFHLTARSMFTDDRKQQFGDNSDLMLFSGIFQSFRYNAANKPMVNIDVAHFPALRNDISLLQYMQMQAQGKLNENMRKQDFVRFLTELLSGKMVRARYGTSVTYRLEGFDTNFTPSTAKFEVTERKKAARIISVLEYMQSIKKLKITQADQPLLVAKIPPKADDGDKEEDGGAKGGAKGKGKKKGGGGGGDKGNNRTPTWLLPELLEFSIGETRKRDLDANERSTMITLTRQTPEERFHSIEQNANDVRSNTYWQNFAIPILKQFEVDAKVLNPVELVYANNVQMTPSDGTWNLDGLKLFETPAGKQNWGVIYPGNRFDDVNSFVENFVSLSSVSGYDIQKEPEYTEIRNPSPNEYVLALKHAANANKDKKIAFYVVILPDKDATRYQHIKAVSNTELGIATQCVVLDGRRPPPNKQAKHVDKSVLGNIIAGINPKISFQNCIILPDRLSKCLGGRKLDSLMVMGLDVFHGNTQDESRPSVVALCAATNVHYTKYATALRTQSARKEIVEELDSMVAEVMQEYIAQRKVPPKEILFYRDGVGEGMYDLVKEEEIKQLMRVMGDFCLRAKVDLPKLTFLVVQKRNHLRSLAKDTPKGNPYPGTFIDDKNVVDFERPNFYLYSHKALAGTARPTHYQVLEDFNKFTVTQLAEFTYALAHLHQGCTKAVSLPAPVFYADRACGMAGACYRLQASQMDRKLLKSLFMI